MLLLSHDRSHLFIQLTPGKCGKHHHNLLTLCILVLRVSVRVICVSELQQHGINHTTRSIRTPLHKRLQTEEKITSSLQLKDTSGP